MGFCPEWVFNICSARVAFEYLGSEMPINAVAGKYAGGLSKHYDQLKVEELLLEAEDILRFLAEINVEDASETLQDYIYFTLKFEKLNTPRKLKSIFGSALDASKKKDYKPGSALKNFKAYVFGLRSGTVEKSTPGWNPSDEENLDFLGELFAAEVSIIDALATE